MKEELEINIDETNISKEDALLYKLKHILNYELSSSVFYFLHFSAGMIVLYLSALAAIIFTPFLIYVLAKSHKFGWLAIFVIIVVLPAIVILIISPKTIYSQIFLLIQLGAFYAYCFVIRLVVVDWVEEIKWKSIRKGQKERSKRSKLFFNVDKIQD